MDKQHKELHDFMYEIADTYMVEMNYKPIKLSVTSSFNLDAHVMMYKCMKPNCKSPYLAIAVTEMELLQERFIIDKLVKKRCEFAIKGHYHA